MLELFAVNDINPIFGLFLSIINLLVFIYIVSTNSVSVVFSILFSIVVIGAITPEDEVSIYTFTAIMASSHLMYVLIYAIRNR